MRFVTLAFLTSCSLTALSMPDPPVVDCASMIDFLEDEVMALSHTAAFGESCVTIETMVYFGENGVAEELDAEGDVIGSFSYMVTEVDGQCALASAVSNCEVQLLSMNGEGSVMTMSLNGAEATLTPLYCPFPPELGDVAATSASGFGVEDASLTVEVADGVPTSIQAAGLNGSGDYAFAWPGDVEGLLAGLYSVTAVDEDDCSSEAVTVIVPYDLCCACGVSDVDADGLCDDEDNCTDKTAPNYADPGNTPCALD